MQRHLAKISGFKVDLFNFSQALQFAQAESEEHSIQIVTINPEMIEYGLKNQEFKQLVLNSDLVVPDGIGIKLALKIKGFHKQEVIPGVEFALKLIELAYNTQQNVALIGAKEDVLQLCKKNLSEKYEGLKICYSHNGYFLENEEAEIVKDLINSKPKVVLVALGSPKQENFISKYKNEFKNTIFIGIGGSFDVYAGVTKRAPVFWQKIGCEWLYRTLKEPKRIKRIFPTLPLFLLRVVFGNNK